MLKANRKTLIITSTVTILPVLIGIICWDRLPDVMATHFGMNNEANGFSSKVFAVFGLPLVLLAVLWVGAFVTAHDPKRQNISSKMFSLVVWIAPVTSLVVAAILYPVNLGYALDTDVHHNRELPAKSKTELHDRDKDSLDPCKRGKLEPDTSSRRIPVDDLRYSDDYH